VSLTIRDLMQRAYETAAQKGWHNRRRSPLEFHALIHSEISEATEAVRDGLPPFVQKQVFVAPLTMADLVNSTPDTEIVSTQFVPEGEVVELADAIIRIADYCESLGYDLEGAIEAKLNYNSTRGYRHGNKRF
jgi:hypothetical protein